MLENGLNKFRRIVSEVSSSVGNPVLIWIFFDYYIKDRWGMEMRGGGKKLIREKKDKTISK